MTQIRGQHQPTTPASKTITILRTVLEDVFRRYPQIWAVYLFGSTAEGRARQDSDIDLGVVLRPGTSQPNKLDLLADLVEAGVENVDVVFLNPIEITDIVLWFEVIRHNQVVYAAENFDRGTMFSKIIRMYWDFLPILDAQRRAYKERIQRGQDRGDTQTVTEVR